MINELYIVYAVVFVFGIFIGSFLNVCIYRMPKGMSVVRPRSHCVECGVRLKARELVPILSYVFLKGACRNCSARISLRYPLIEFANGVIFVAMLYKFGLGTNFIGYSFMLAILIVIFFVDIEHMIIPNELVIAGVAGNIILWIISRKGINGVSDSLMGAFIGAGCLGLIALIGYIAYKTDEAMGMGDIKLMIPVGLLLGVKLTVATLLISIVLAGIWGFCMILFKEKDRKDSMAFGPFICIGVMMCVIYFG